MLFLSAVLLQNFVCIHWREESEINSKFKIVFQSHISFYPIENTLMLSKPWDLSILPVNLIFTMDFWIPIVSFKYTCAIAKNVASGK